MKPTDFNLYWNLLLEKWNRQPSAALTRLYAVTVQAEGITAEQWGNAVAASIRYDQFFPSIQQLLDYARGGRDFDALALSEWDACLERLMANQTATLPGTETRRLMNLATNGRPLVEVADKELVWIKREFLKRYADHLKAQAAGTTPALLTSTKRELPHASD